MSDLFICLLLNRAEPIRPATYESSGKKKKAHYRDKPLII